jgi:uroporphyrinogen decarboxylase
MKGRERFLRAARGETVDRPPVWLMRQAGRYLPEYQKLKGERKFLDLCRDPDTAQEITMQPLRRFPIDAAIIFSDILIVPWAMGQNLEYPVKGPVLSPAIEGKSGIDSLTIPEPEKDYAFLGSALEQVREELGDDRALLGFAGAPFTLACYMIGGGVSKDITAIKRFIYHNPELYARLAELLTDAVADLLLYQLKAGADAVQLFDTWGGLLSPEEYRRFALPYQQRVFGKLKEFGAPTILYVKGVAGKTDLVEVAGSDIISLDWNIDLAEARRIFGEKTLQGNMDPTMLFAPPEAIAKKVRSMHEQAQGGGYIVNLGHGVLPGTPVEGVRAFVNAVNELEAVGA